MDDPFSFLTAGVKFNKQRFNKEISTFQKRGSARQQQPEQQQQQGALSVNGQPSRKKRKAPNQPSHEPADATPGISVFGSNARGSRNQENDDDDVSDEGVDEDQQQQQQQQQQHRERIRSGREANPRTSAQAPFKLGRNSSSSSIVYWPGLAAEEAGVPVAVDPGCPVATTGDALEAANVVRKYYKIKVSGPEPSPPLRSWHDLQLCACSSSNYSYTTASQHASVPDYQNGNSVLNTSSSQDGSGVGVGHDGQSITAGNSARTSPKSVEWLLLNLRTKGYEQPTPIQRQAIPTLMASRELLAVAPTGSGKTVAFCAPILLHLKALRAHARKAAQHAEEVAQQAQQQGSTSKAVTPAKGQPPSSKKAKRGGADAALAAAAEAAAAAKEMWPDAIKAVILSPSHELTAQQGRVLKQLLPGSNLKASILTRSTAAGTNFSKVDILLANPLRLATLADEGKIDLSHVRYLVLDEADKLFEMGFVEQIDAVLSACKHKSIVRALFSATLPEKVEGLARTVLVEPLRVTVGVRNTAVNTVDQRLLFVGRENGKLLALRQLLTEGMKPPVLVFVATKDRARALHKELMYDGVRADSLSASQSMAARTAAVDNFRSGRTWVLVSTDLIGRGMDFIGVNTVINYDMPTTTTDYIHRIGRTGRAGHSGTAVTFFTEEDKPVLRPVANLIRESGGDVPDWMTKMKKVRAKDRKKMKLSEKEASGSTISTQTKEEKQKAKKRAMIAASKAKKARMMDKQA